MTIGNHTQRFIYFDFVELRFSPVRRFPDQPAEGSEEPGLPQSGTNLAQPKSIYPWGWGE